MVKRRKILSLFLMLTVLGTMISWSDNDELKKRERELETLKEQIEALDASISQNQSLQSTTNTKIKNTSEAIKGLEREIDQLDSDIGDTEGEIDIKTVELADAEASISDKNQLLDSRLRVMYKTGSIGYLEVLFGSEDFSDLLSRIDMLQKILLHDQNLIKELKAQRDAIAEKKLALEGVKQELETLFQSKSDKQDQLEVQLRDLVAYKEDLKQDEAALNEAEGELLDEADQLTNVIKNLKLSDTYVGGEMMWPVPGNTIITSDFGMRVHPITKQETMHTGIDISAALNSTVVAAQSGTVIYADWYGGYGKVVIIDHGGGYSTLYAHNNSLLVAVGDVVSKGDTIAKSGSTGFSTGPHVHFEVRVNGEYVDPIPYVKGN
jgi:murein DD-endopeptidase MepM/ murein hydrolase activator NlpD